METEPKKSISYTIEYIVGAGYVLFFCLAITLCSLYYYFTYLQTPVLQPKSSVVNPIAKTLPAMNPTPHVSLADQANETKILEEDFSKDHYHWMRYTDGFKEEVRKGKLYFASRNEDSWEFTDCQLCPILRKPFYLQADLTTTEATDQSFGIVFGLNRTNDNFYSFLINTESKRYYFYHLNFFGWSLRASGESNLIKSFPDENILGIYADHDTVEFYVNGEMIDAYTETGANFQFGYFGFYVDDSGFELIVDNLVIREAGKK